MENITVAKKDLQEIFQTIKITFIINTLVATLISLIIPQTDFIRQFLAAQSIGLTIVTIISITNILVPPLKENFSYQYLFLPFPALIATLIGFNFLRSYSSFSGLYLVILIVSLPALLVFHYRHSKKQATLSLQEEKQKRELSEKQLLESKLLLLQAQINPHFLFNTLANISAYIDISPDKAKDLLQHYTDFLRRSLHTTESTEGVISNEVDLITSYMAIQQMRFPDIEFRKNIDKQLLNTPLPPLLIQPLIENALLHGLAPQGNQGVIKLTISRVKEQIVIDVTDNGVGFKEGNSGCNGVAVKNIKSRLQIYKAQSCLQLAENRTGGVHAQLNIPL